MIWHLSRDEKDKSRAVEALIAGSSPRREFFLMVVFSVTMATLGLLLNNATIIIGSMLIAPLLLPALSFSLGLALGDNHLIGRSISTLIKASLIGGIVAVVMSLIYTLITSENVLLNEEILSRLQLSPWYFLVALIAGLAAAYALAKPTLSATLPGVAIAVALIPPLAVTGIGIANRQADMAAQASILYLANIGGIIVAGWLVFRSLRLSRQVEAQAVRRDEEELKRGS